MTYLFHITNIDNLESIIRADGLYSKNRVSSLGLSYTSIANENIQEQRTTLTIPFNPGGCLHDYVPFFFCIRPPMLYLIKQGGVETYSGNQEEIIYLVTAIELIVKHSLQFVFTDGHAIMKITQFYDSLDELNKIDWKLIRAKYWADTTDDPDRKRRRQAEFLLYEHLPWCLIKGLVVFNERMLGTVNEILKGHKHVPKVYVKQGWYY